MIMKRKLVKQGMNALTITLPSEWIKRKNLKPGDEVEMFESEESLNISTEKKLQAKEITVDASGLIPRLADRFLARSYQKGYDKITVKFDSSEIEMAIKNKIPELMGYEVLNTTKNSMDVQIISTNLDLDFDTLLRRAFFLLMEMAETCHDAWKNADNKSLENIFYKDYDVNRFLYFCLRKLNTSHEMASFGRSILYYLIETLEDLGDELKALGKILAECKVDKDILLIIKKMNELLRMSYEFFYEPKKKKAVDAFLLAKETQKLIDECLGKKNKDMTKALIALEVSMRIISHLTTMRLDTLKELSGEKR